MSDPAVRPILERLARVPAGDPGLLPDDPRALPGYAWRWVARRFPTTHDRARALGEGSGPRLTLALADALAEALLRIDELEERPTPT